jgi:signal transduction histidine kinase
MNGADSDTAIAGRLVKPWPKVHLVYFLLAAIDLMAIMGGLFLSHQVIRVFERNVGDVAALDRLMASSWILIDTAGDAQAAAGDVLITRDPHFARMLFTTKLQEVRQEAARLQKQIDTVLPERAAKRATGIMVRIGTAAAEMERTAIDISAKIERNDSAGAVKELAALQSRYQRLRDAVGDFNRLVSIAKVSAADQSKEVVEGLRKYEYLIGSMIAIIVCCVAAYGLWIGRLIKQKYTELEQSNAELAAAQSDSNAFATRLQAINEDVTQLNRELADNMRKLRETQDEMVKRGRLAQLGQLTATVAHELRNPLGAVRTSAYVLARRVKDKGLAVEPQIERINNGIVRCDKIITELLDFSRSSAPILQSRRIDDWLAEAVETQAAKMPESVAFECVLRLGDLEAKFDPDRLERVIINLIQNACEAMVGKPDAPVVPQGYDPRITVMSKHSARGIEISIADNGPGIPDDILPHIREPLYSTKSFGTGLGLPAVERILEQHGGGLEVETSSGSGACFTFWFPLEPATSAAA